MEPVRLKDQISGYCHEDHGKEHAVYMDGGYGSNALLDDLDL